MDSTRRLEVREFLTDICAYLRNGLRSLEYQNTALGFEETETKSQELLHRCETILQYFENDINAQPIISPISPVENSYLDMSQKRAESPSEYVHVMCPDKSADELIDIEVYDICSITASTSSSPEEKPIGDDSDFFNCPYFGLPAAHLTLKKSPKQGLLNRIEKRLFFDQSKKLHCGIVSDWLLCYTDATASIKPSLCIPLSGADIEHYGEGKRRDLCFQISTSDGSRKYIFQSTSDIETKTWIHAIEAALRGDKSPNNESPKCQKLLNINNNMRKLPTPPAQNKIYKHSMDNSLTTNEDIYEEPCPIYTTNNQSNIPNLPKESPPNIPAKAGRAKQSDTRSKPEYDTPKTQLRSIEHIDLEMENQPSQKTEFQTMIKTVQQKLSNQLLLGRSPDNHKKSPTQYDKKKKTQSAATSPSNSTPVKNWFSRLNKTSSSTSHQLKDNENLLSSQRQQHSRLLASPKGEKVNMIIHQLETNGRLPFFKNNLFIAGEHQNPSDQYNYEPVNTQYVI